MIKKYNVTSKNHIIACLCKSKQTVVCKSSILSAPSTDKYLISETAKKSETASKLPKSNRKR